jgi:hypothetical protein
MPSCVVEWYAQTYEGPPHNVAGRMALDADDVARVIQRAITSRKPRGRYPVGDLARGLFFAQRALPSGLFDAFVRSQFPTPYGHPAPDPPLWAPHFEPASPELPHAIRRGRSRRLAGSSRQVIGPH